MNESELNQGICVVIGASHAGVNFAFAARKEGWQGEIILIDSDTNLPYHRPPLSKVYLSKSDGIESYLLKSENSYEEARITLRLGVSVVSIDPENNSILLQDGEKQAYSKLVLAIGASAFIPPIPGLKEAKKVFSIRRADDVDRIKKALQKIEEKKVLIIGGGYIGLEIAASIKKMGADVKVLEREERILSRVTATEMSTFFQELHNEQGVEILTQKNVIKIEDFEDHNKISCSDGSQFEADIIIVGVGIKVNCELAEEAGIHIQNGIKVDGSMKTNIENILAIGDCTFHYNPHYDRYVRLESVQNAVDQAKIAATTINGKEKVYDSIPWFWSDQYDVKLQIVGLSDGYNKAIVRQEEEKKFSIWYFKDKELLAVDAINNAKAYVLGTKFLQKKLTVDPNKIGDPSIPMKPANFLVS
ncbi:MAG: FAD-dependent oxidoreductase [Bacteroidota bacterium]